MPTALQRFRSYDIAADTTGASLELWRTDREVVCLASEPDKQRWVELHVLAGVDANDTSARPAVERFRSRIQALLRVHDRRVLEILEAGEDEGALFYVSEFVDGETLDAYLARCAPVPAWWGITLALQLTRGLIALNGTPGLLAAVQMFNARITLEGENTSDALVKLADFALGGADTESGVEAANAEASAIRDVGRILCYSLSGMLADQITGSQLAGLPLPPEISDLLARLLGRPGRSGIRDLKSLHTILCASAQAPGLATPPVRLPPVLRPRLQLAPHFPTLARLAAEIGEGYRLERSPFDSAHPYFQRAFDGATPITVQLLPPSRLLEPRYLPLIRRAAEQASSRPTAHALHVLQLPAIDDPGWFLEESPPRLSLETIRAWRPSLTPSEAAFLVRLWATAVQSLEASGLTPVAISPAHVYAEFVDPEGSPPGDDELTSRPVTSWPAFRLKMRAHPTATQLIHPHRFRRERLLDPGPARARSDPPPGPPDGIGSPSTADAAALFAWLCGGLHLVPADLRPVVDGALDGSRPLTRTALVEALSALIPRAPKKTAPRKKANSTPPTAAAPAKQERRSRRGTQRIKSPSTADKAHKAPTPAVPPSKNENTAPAPAAAIHFGQGAGTDALLHLPDLLEGENDSVGDTEMPLPGFAEALLGASHSSDTEVIPRALLPAHSLSDSDEAEPPPIGALFGNTSSEPMLDEVEIKTQPAFDFSTRSDLERGPGWGRLLILIVLVALVIAAMMAHFTGLAPWR